MMFLFSTPLGHTRMLLSVCLVRKQRWEWLLVWAISIGDGWGLYVFSSSCFFRGLLHIPALLMSVALADWCQGGISAGFPPWGQGWDVPHMQWCFCSGWAGGPLARKSGSCPSLCTHLFIALLSNVASGACEVRLFPWLRLVKESEWNCLFGMQMPDMAKLCFCHSDWQVKRTWTP